MTSATVTTRGQVTIPADVRERLGPRAGSWIAFVATPGGYEIRSQTASVHDLEGVVPAPTRPVGVEETEEAVAAEAAAGRW